MDQQIEINSWLEEKRSAYLYQKIAEKVQGNEADLFKQLSVEAEEQAGIWANAIKAKGGKLPSFKPNLRLRLVVLLLQWFSINHLKTILAAMKIRGMSLYFAPKISGHPIPQTLAEVGHRHKTANANNLRAAIFGVNDGLVSNASLIFGMMGAATSTKTIIIAGFAGLLAGACSMAAGEYVSVRSQREMYEKQIAFEKEELELYPEAETAELALIYEARGLDKIQATAFAETIMKDHNKALDALARDELGLNPDELVSPWGAAFFSFFAFTFGALMPILPCLIFPGQFQMTGVIILTAICLFVIGNLVSLFTGRNALLSGARMLLIGSIAGLVTYFAGHLLTLII